MSEQDLSQSTVNSLQDEIVLLRDECEQYQNEIALLQSECESYQKVIKEMQGNWEEFSDLLNIWEKEKAELLFHINRKSDYEPFRSWSGGFEVWQTYFRENYSSITKRSNDLKQGLDKESCEIIDLIMERNFFVFPQQKYIDYFLVNHRRLLTDRERMGCFYNIQAVLDIREKYHLPDSYIPEPTVMEYHSGLTILPDNIQKSIKGRDVLDGGALCGDSSLMFCLYSPGKIFAFEPVPESFDSLVSVIEANDQFDVIIPVKMGLGDKCEISKLFCYDGAVMSSNMAGMSHSMRAVDKITEIPMDMTTIDKFTAEHNLDVGLIKLDIEGNELAAIHGAMDTIKR